MKINMFLVLISFAGAAIYVFLTTKKPLHMLQDNIYNENNRYLKWIFRNKKEALVNYNSLSFILLLIAYIFKFKYMNIFLMLIFPLLYLSLKRYNKYMRLKDQAKRPLVITKRVKRLIFTYFLIYLIPFMIAVFHNKLAIPMLLIVLLMLSFNYFTLLLAMLINMPVEKGVFYYYMFKAKAKLKSMSNLKILAVTGSYGKTSLKNIIKDVLATSYNCFATPKSINTLNGSMIQINNNLTKYEDVFISEMGAYVRGEIKGLCKLIRPKYGAITTIGLAHLETFGSQENIQKAKFELIESLPSDGLAVLNMDDEKQRTYKLRNKVRIKWVSTQNKDADLYASNIKYSKDGITFNVKFKESKETVSFETKLLGSHNIYNILEALAFAEEFDVPFTKMQQAVKKLRPTEHRLEIREFKDFTQIDDAFNSNPVGAKNALKVLSFMDGYKVVVTPGMIELGEKEDELNKEFGKEMAGAADLVILVGEKKTKVIKEGLLEEGFSEDNIIVINNVRDSFPILSELKKELNKNIIALYENDLPDSYNE